MTTASVSLTLGTFSPDVLPGLVAWYDFSDISTLWQDNGRSSLVTTDGQEILGVTDKSGAANHLTTSGSGGPTYKVNIQKGMSVARFDGTNDRLEVSDTSKLRGTGGFTVLVVYTATYGSEDFLFGNAATTDAFGYRLYFHSSGDGVQTFRAGKTGQSATWIVTGSDFGTEASWKVGAYNFDAGTGAEFWINGTSRGSTADADIHDAGTGKWTLMASQPLTAFTAGDIAEILVYEPDVNGASRDSLESYLGSRWGITVA